MSDGLVIFCSTAKEITAHILHHRGPRPGCCGPTAVGISTRLCGYPVPSSYGPVHGDTLPESGSWLFRGQCRSVLYAARLGSVSPTGRGYPSGPATVNSSLPESILLSSVQIAPCASQFVVAGNTMVTVPSPSGWTSICHPTLLDGFSRAAFTTPPPVTVNVWSRRVL